MPSLVGSTVTANYLKTAPTTNFGTRALTVIKVAIANVYTSSSASNSLFTKSVRALQQTAEVWAVFTPVDGSGSGDYFHAIIASDTQWSGDSANQGLGGVADNAGYGILETAIAAGNGSVSATVTVPTGFVVPFYRADTSL